MTIKQLYSQFKPGNVHAMPDFQAMIAHARTVEYRPHMGNDATALINNEGAQRGFKFALDYLTSLQAPKPEAPEKTEPKPTYQDPTK